MYTHPITSKELGLQGGPTNRGHYVCLLIPLKRLNQYRDFSATLQRCFFLNTFILASSNL